MNDRVLLFEIDKDYGFIMEIITEIELTVCKGAYCIDNNKEEVYGFYIIL